MNRCRTRFPAFLQRNNNNMHPTFQEKQSTLFERVKSLRANATESELIFADRLEKAGIKYIFQKGFIVGDCYCIADFYLPKPYKTVIEIDGDYHFSPQQIAKDKWRDSYLIKDRGFKVVRIKNIEVNTFDLSLIV